MNTVVSKDASGSYGFVTENQKIEFNRIETESIYRNWFWFSSRYEAE